jgi:hypothetical protein
LAFSGQRDASVRPLQPPERTPPQHSPHLADAGATQGRALQDCRRSAGRSPMAQRAQHTAKRSRVRGLPVRRAEDANAIRTTEGWRTRRLLWHQRSDRAGAGGDEYRWWEFNLMTRGRAADEAGPPKSSALDAPRVHRQRPVLEELPTSPRRASSSRSSTSGASASTYTGVRWWVSR